jgi:hypothetical protein
MVRVTDNGVETLKLLGRTAIPLATIHFSNRFICIKCFEKYYYYNCKYSVILVKLIHSRLTV